MTFPTLRSVRAGLGLLLLAVGPATGLASVIDTMIQQFQRSDFVFGRTDGNAPFPPMAWVAFKNHGESELTLDGTVVRFDENAISQMLVAPVWIGKKDMILAGEYAAWQQIGFNAPRAAQRDVYTFVPLVAWMRQIEPRSQLGVFVAPEYTKGGEFNGHEFTEWSAYTGVIVLRWSTESFAWVYGGVAAFSPDSNMLLPYLGTLWLPNPRWTVAMLLPWPGVTYAPSRNYMFRLGLSPADATLASNDGEDLHLGYTSWNLALSASHRVVGNIWATAYAGYTGFGSFNIGNDDRSTKLDRGMVWSLEISVRPPSQGPGKKKQ
jgi:hypothetical protein